MTKPAAVKNILKIRFVITRGYFCDLNVRKIFFEKFSAAAKFGFFRISSSFASACCARTGRRENLLKNIRLFYKINQL